MVAGKVHIASGFHTTGTKMKNNKSLGQHWLKNREILDQIAVLSFSGRSSDPSSRASSLGPRRNCGSPSKDKTAICLEIGPGLGTLTSSLLKRFSEVIAVEFDQNLAKNLPKSFPGKNLKVINEDILKIDINEVLMKSQNKPSEEARLGLAPRSASEDGYSRLPKYVVAGNIPYYITSPIITKFLTSENKPERIVLLIQKEVAERIVATTGHHTYLSLFAQNFASVSLGPVVKRGEFTPPPKVDSQVIVLEPLKTSKISEKVLNFAKIGFSQPRKKLTANLAHFYHLDKQKLKEALISLNLSPDCRPSDLSHQDWQKLYDIINL